MQDDANVDALENESLIGMAFDQYDELDDKDELKQVLFFLL